MSITTDMERLAVAKADLKSAIESKGVSVPGTTKLDGYAALVEQISGGGGTTDPELPSGYTRKDWIHGNGDVYIDTGISGVCFWHIKVQVDSGTGSAIIAHGTSFSQYFLVTSAGNLGFSTDSGCFTTAVSAYAKLDIFIDFPTNRAYACISGIDIGKTGTYTRTGNFLLFTRSSGHTPIKAKFWVADCYKAGARVFHGIPCVRALDGASGLYDTVSETFFTGTGSGSFTSGNDNE